MCRIIELSRRRLQIVNAEVADITEAKSLRPGTGTLALTDQRPLRFPKPDSKLDATISPSPAARRIADELYRQPRGTPAADGLLRLDRLGLGGPRPGNRIPTPTTSRTSRSWGTGDRRRPPVERAESDYPPGREPRSCSSPSAGLAYLGWQGKGEHVHPQMLPGVTTASQRATIKFFVLVALLFLAQVTGAAAPPPTTGPIRAVSTAWTCRTCLPSNLLRTWHLQLAIFWIATAYIAGGLFLAPAAGRERAARAGDGASTCSLAPWSSSRRAACWGNARHQPAAGQALVLVRASGLGVSRARPGLADPAGRRAGPLAGAALPGHQRQRSKIPSEAKYRCLFLCAALAIPIFYLPAMFLQQHQPFLRRGYLALLDHPSLGGGFLRAVRHGHGRGHLLSTGHGLAH